MDYRRIIPCLDFSEGRVVKGVRFVNLRDAGDPVEAAKAYCDDGADELVLLDINATREGRGTLLDIVPRVAEQLTIPFTIGGGIANLDLMRELLSLGADRESINTPAVRDPDLIEDAAIKFGSQRLTVAIDVRRVSPDKWTVMISGGTVDAGLDAVEWAQTAARRGAGEILLTSMDADGARDGYDLAATRAVADAVSIPVVASGGAGTLEHFREALTVGGADAALAAGLFHDKVLTIRQVKEYLSAGGIPVRL